MILLSARAGEESRVEGIEAGADDYLVKPFTARELLARVTTHLAMSRLRRQAAERERELRQDAEAARERATSAVEALRRANSDLEQFAFSASHDLQEPLRMVATFSQLLQMKYARQAGRASRHHHRALRGRRHAHGAHDPGSAGIHARGQYLRRAAGNGSAWRRRWKRRWQLAGFHRRSPTPVVTHDPLPVLQVEPVHLQQIFQNLVSNAIKYRGSQPPRIHIGAVPRWELFTRAASGEFSVQDNGIGIEPRYKDQVFGLFKRLHSGSRYSGTGLGLAICKKLVERYHGRIWVESQPGAGSTFFFTLAQSEVSQSELAQGQLAKSEPA